MVENTQSATLSALKRADFDAEPVGDQIALRPEDLNALLARAAAIQDSIELRKVETGADTRLVKRCAVMMLSWTQNAEAKEAAQIQTLEALRAALRRTDIIIRRAPSEVIVIAHRITERDAVELLLERIMRALPNTARAGYAMVGHPTRLHLPVESAISAWRGTTTDDRVRVGEFSCPAVA
ncbi:MAG: hypothetical protein AAFU55_02735 [Pseudomonadota bacterium]